MKSENMKDCEPLRGKITRKFMYTDKGFDYNSVKSAVNFYKKYRNNEELLSKEQNYIFHEWYPNAWVVDGQYMDIAHKGKAVEACEEYNKRMREYNNWLFDYCFGDVIEKKVIK